MEKRKVAIIVLLCIIDSKFIDPKIALFHPKLIYYRSTKHTYYKQRNKLFISFKYTYKF